MPTLSVNENENENKSKHPAQWGYHFNKFKQRAIFNANQRQVNDLIFTPFGHSAIAKEKPEYFWGFRFIYDFAFQLYDYLKETIEYTLLLVINILGMAILPPLVLVNLILAGLGQLTIGNLTNTSFFKDWLFITEAMFYQWLYCVSYSFSNTFGLAYFVLSTGLETAGRIVNSFLINPVINLGKMIFGSKDEQSKDASLTSTELNDIEAMPAWMKGLSSEPTAEANPTQVAQLNPEVKPTQVAKPPAVAQPKPVAKPPTVAQPKPVAKPATVAQPKPETKPASEYEQSQNESPSSVSDYDTSLMPAWMTALPGEHIAEAKSTLGEEQIAKSTPAPLHSISSTDALISSDPSTEEFDFADLFESQGDTVDNDAETPRRVGGFVFPAVEQPATLTRSGSSYDIESTRNNSGQILRRSKSLPNMFFSVVTTAVSQDTVLANTPVIETQTTSNRPTTNVLQQFRRIGRIVSGIYSVFNGGSFFKSPDLSPEVVGKSPASSPEVVDDSRNESSATPTTPTLTE